MKTFLESLLNGLVGFITGVGAWRTSKQGSDFLAGLAIIVLFIAVIAIFAYIFWVIFFNKNDDTETKLKKIATALSGLAGGVVGIQVVG